MRGSAGRAATDLDVQRACLVAQEAVTEPNTGSGLYERVDAWLKAAGAPYATGEAAADDPRTFVSGELGLLSSIGSDTSSWGSSYAYLFPKDLLDFNHEATVNGEHFVPCASPLTSKNPCGPVGPYNAQFEAGIDYGGINGHWKAVTAEILVRLLSPYISNRFGTTDGTLGDFMYSIGFSQAVKDNGLIVTTADTGLNTRLAFGCDPIPTICFMDTAAPRDKAKQPWCDGPSGEDIQGTDNLVNFNGLEATQAKYLDDIASQPEFYALSAAETNNKCVYNPTPGWFVFTQEHSDTAEQRALYWQYHWPVTNVSEIGCQNGKPYLNPGGLLSRCAGDLQEYVDALLPPPESDTTALDASVDTTLLEDQPNRPNRNMGEDPLLAAGSQGANEFVVTFADGRLQQFLAGVELSAAILRLSLAERGSPQKLEIIPLAGGFVEGKGSMGTGATWNCAEDADVSDNNANCLQHWPASRFADGVTRQPDQKDMPAGLIGFDVTNDVEAGISAWLIQPPDRGASGGAYDSDEGAIAAREPWRAPTLLLERRAADAALRPPTPAGRAKETPMTRPWIP